MTVDLDEHLPGIRRGESEAFAAWLSAAEPSLRRGLRSFARTVDVESVLQEALLRVWQVAPRFEPDGRPNALVRFAHRIGTNLAISETRRAGRTTSVDPAILGDGADEAARWEQPQPDPLLREHIATCREKLPPRPKAALAARLDWAGAVADLTLAEQLTMTKNTFLQNITRARKLLLECLQRAGVDLATELS